MTVPPAWWKHNLTFDPTTVLPFFDFEDVPSFYWKIDEWYWTVRQLLRLSWCRMLRKDDGMTGQSPQNIEQRSEKLIVCQPQSGLAWAIWQRLDRDVWLFHFNPYLLYRGMGRFAMTCWSYPTLEVHMLSSQLYTSTQHRGKVQEELQGPTPTNALSLC